MRKTTHENTLNYIFDGTRKGAKYSLNNGKSWGNHGEYAECLAKHCLGYAAEKDANTAFNMGHDIAELNASVKSWKCSLTDVKLGNNFTEYMDNFFMESDPNTTYIMVNDYAEKVDLYYMNGNEFKVFVEKFGTWDSSRNKIRLTKSMNSMVNWMESQL